MDVESLLAVISPEEPSGPDLEFTPDFISLAEKLRGIPEDYLAKRPAQPPNWADVRDLAVNLLARTHDLRLALSLVTALVHTDGFAGLSDGLHLLRGFVERFWDSVHPQLDVSDENDPTARMNTISGLIDFETVLKPILLVPLVESPIGRFCLRDIRVANGKKAGGDSSEDTVSLATVQAAFENAPVDNLRSKARSIAECMEHLSAAEATLTSHVGVTKVPDLSPLAGVFGEIAGILSEHLGRLGVGADTESHESEASADVSHAAPTVGRGRSAPGAINSRQDVLQALDAICEYYVRNEPSSPVPLLLKRARTLASKDFLEIIRDIAPDSLAHVQLIAGPNSPQGMD